MQRQGIPHTAWTNSLLIAAGEASGDAYGGALVRELHANDAQLQTYGLGGAQMRSAGVETLFDVEALNTVGAMEGGMKLLQGWRMMRRLLREALRRRTRVAVLIDVPFFNLPFARQLKKAGLRVVYYVSPQIWAWRQGRVKKIARRVDKMLTLFPFEVPFYTAAGVDAECVGHPLVDRLNQLPLPQQAAKMLGLDPNRPTVALLPGSRWHEVNRLLPAMLEAWQCIKQRLPQIQGVLPVAETVSLADVQRIVRSSRLDITVLPGQSTTALCTADFALIASGTATLEAGVIGTPMVVVYKVHPITAWLAKCLIRIPHIGLVNIVAGRQVVPELLQRQVQPQRIAACALQSLEHPEAAHRMRADLRLLRHTLGPGDSTRRAAAHVRQFIYPASAPTVISPSEIG